MLVLLAGVAFAQESRFEIAAGFGATQTLEPAPVEVSGGFGARFNPNGATFRLSVLESASSTALIPELMAQVGARARQRQIAVGSGFEFDLLRQSSSRTALPGLWFDASFGPWTTRAAWPQVFLLDRLRLDLGMSFLGANQLDHSLVRGGWSLALDEGWTFGFGITAVSSAEEASSTWMFTVGQRFGARKSDSPP